MANWCDNYVSFYGDEENVAKVIDCFKEMETRSNEFRGQGVVPKQYNDVCEEGFFFDIFIDGESISYQSKWSPNIEDLNKVAKEYGISYSCRYYEPGNLVYGKCSFKDGVFSDVYLLDADFPEYDFEKDAYTVDGKIIESEEEYLSDTLEKKINNLKTIKHE